jgi:hypothetical protein
MNDWMDFGADFPAAFRDVIRTRVFAWRAFHNLADEAFKTKLHRVSDEQFDVWITAPDRKPPTSETILFAASVAQALRNCLRMNTLVGDPGAKQSSSDRIDHLGRSHGTGKGTGAT